MLSGKTAIVTGSSNGIGRAIAERFGREGANVTVNYYSDEDGANAARDVIEDSGSEALVVQADVSRWDDSVSLVERTREAFGEVDVLVNNAGMFPRITWENLTRDEWDRVLGVNLGGLFNLSKQVLPRMADRGDGVVINMSSTWAIKGGPDNAAYTASKGGINAVTRQMCYQFAADGVRVNAITPGPVKTSMNEELREDPEYIKAVQESVPAARFGESEEIAGVAAFLAGPDAKYIHGENIVVDGGMTA
jgi:NAD(P)-dependent dehydrogenase (short-subunit alcohol dehydrogenase family)